MLTIVTLNSWKCDGAWAARLNAMKQGLAALDADVICLQECFATLPGAGVEADTARALADHLAMGLFQAPSRRKERVFEGRPVISTSGLAILVRPDAGEADMLALPSDPRDGERIAQSVLLRTGGTTLRVVNTHLTHLRDAGALRAAQIDTILHHWCGGTGPVVIAGDLNAPLQAPEFTSLHRRADLDAGPVAPGTWPATLIEGARTPDRAIDHILLLRGTRGNGPRLVARRLVLDSPSAQGIQPSDHAAVLAEIDPGSEP